jgi:uncharacterized protein YdhG (YjbR/CyaY superfamily)
MPAFKLHGHLVAFGAFKQHLSFLPINSALLKTLPEATSFTTSTGTMHVQPDKPIPRRAREEDRQGASRPEP